MANNSGQTSGGTEFNRCLSPEVFPATLLEPSGDFVIDVFCCSSEFIPKFDDGSLLDGASSRQELSGRCRTGKSHEKSDCCFSPAAKGGIFCLKRIMGNFPVDRYIDA